MASARLPRAARLHGRRTFRQLFQEGIPVRGTWSSLVGRPNGLGKSRFSCSIRRQTVASAVARNRLKRRMRELFRKNKEFFPHGLDLMVIVARSPESGSTAIIEAEIRKLLKILDLRINPHKGSSASTRPFPPAA